MADVISRFETGLDSYLTKEQIKKECPLAFATEPTNPDVSKRYLFVNTETIIDDLEACNGYSKKRKRWFYYI